MMVSVGGPVEQEKLYIPLNDSVPKIRLLEIEASESAISTVRGHPRHVNLNDSPEYVALSYVWGDASQTQSISIDGQDFAATVNLELALRRIRAKRRRRENPSGAVDATYIRKGCTSTCLGV
jgi:hypothetical protein